MEDFRTGFLKWKWIGTLWTARDPVEEGQRWLIRNSVVNTRLYELCIVSGKVPVDVKIHKSPKHLGYMACASIIERASSINYEIPDKVPRDLVVKSFGFLEGLLVAS